MGQGRRVPGSDARVIVHDDGTQEFLGVRYIWCGRYFYRGDNRLHRVVYAYYYGDPPPGKEWHVHHKDGDRTNNQPENLELVRASEHLSHHNRNPSPERLRQLRRNLTLAREKAAEWHRSPEGRAWHSEHAKGEKERKRIGKCEQCGSEFRHVQRDARFCRKACKAAARRDSGVDDEDRNCLICGAGFRANRYWKKRTCSRKCAGALSGRNR